MLCANYNVKNVKMSLVNHFDKYFTVMILKNDNCTGNDGGPLYLLVLFSIRQVGLKRKWAPK